MKSIGSGTLIISLLVCGSTYAQTPIDPAHGFAWSPTVGWVNWSHDADDVLVHGTYLTGLVWGENVGWINLGNGPPADGVHYENATGADFGVNVDPVTGDLSGLAWGENVGWINFDTSALSEQRAHLSFCEHRFRGFAWGENVGWLNLDDPVHFVAEGPCELFDLRCDGLVTTGDFAALIGWFAGPDQPAACSALDADADGDVDLRDAAEFQIAQSAVD